MSLPLVGFLMLLGFGMGAATMVGAIPKGMELPLWVVIALLGAILAGRSPIRRRFLTGFFGGLLAGLASPLVILVFFDGYLKNNPSASQAFASLPASMSPRLFLAVLAPIIAIAYGLCVGLLAWVAGKVFRPRVPVSS
jgi:hypothetical protein